MGISFPDASHGWAVGDAGTILATSDGGATWVAQDSGVTGGFASVSFPDASHGWAVGDGGYGFIVTTSDGGATWTGQSGVGTGTRSRALPSPTPHTVLPSTETGATSSSIPPTGARPGTRRLAQLALTTPPSGESHLPTHPTPGWSEWTGAIAATTDGGQHWTAQSSGVLQSQTQRSGQCTERFVPRRDARVCGYRVWARQVPAPRRTAASWPPRTAGQPGLNRTSPPQASTPFAFQMICTAVQLVPPGPRTRQATVVASGASRRRDNQ